MRPKSCPVLPATCNQSPARAWVPKRGQGYRVPCRTDLTGECYETFTPGCCSELQSRGDGANRRFDGVIERLDHPPAQFPDQPQQCHPEQSPDRNAS
jgi:hypothetical protein